MTMSWEMDSMESRLEVASACCSALRQIVGAQPSRSRLFLAHGGAAALRNVLQMTSERDSSSKDAMNALFAAAKLLCALADGNEPLVQDLRACGVLEALSGNLAATGKAAEAVMWALGLLGGVGTVFGAMQQTAALPHFVHGGLSVLAELVWHPSEDVLRCYPEAVPAALHL